MEKSYWFFLESHIYVCDKTKSMLLYDTHTGMRLLTKDEHSMCLVRKIYEDENLGVVGVSEKELEAPAVKDFIEQVVSIKMGQLLNQSEVKKKPVILLPILSLNFDMEKFKDKENADLFLTRDISKNLLDVNISLNNTCSQNCSHCGEYSKQFLCCWKDSGNEEKELDADLLSGLLRQISYYPLRTINVTGGNIYKYPSLSLFGVAKDESAKIFNFYVNYLNYQPNTVVDSHKVHIIVNTPLDKKCLAEVCSQLRDMDTKYHAIVRNENDYEEVLSVFDELGISRWDLSPFYDGGNLQFFKENVFISEEDIFDRVISMREIYRNQKMNTNFFGSLYIYPNGEVKANPNTDVIGHLDTDRVIDIIGKEMMQNTAWRDVRSGHPCSDCVFQYLCPPVSNYEKAIGRPNLCSIAL